MIDPQLKYTPEHEWVSLLEGGVAEVGITDFAQEQLGEIVFVDQLEEGKEVKKGDFLCTLESIKTVSDMYAPVSGRIIAINPAVCDGNPQFAPELINKAPYTEGWIARLVMSEPSQVDDLLDDSAYQKLIEAE